MKSRFDRISFIGVLLSLLSVVIVWRMVSIQEEGKFLVEEAVYTEEVDPERGIIYDRDGHILAGNKLVYEVGIQLNQIDGVYGAKAIAEQTSELLGFDYDKIYNYAVMSEEEAGAGYLVIGDFVDPKKIAKLEAEQNRREARGDTSLNGLYWFSHLKRNYPEDDLASNILGFFTFWDRQNGTSHFGIEEEYDDLLAGEPETVTRHLNPSESTADPDIPPGANLMLTIDREIQSMAERIIDAETKGTGSTSGTIIIMDPETGEILAMAVSPRINPNKYEKETSLLTQGSSYNRVVDVNFEPGSVFKVITMAAALDAGVVEPDTTFLDEGSIAVGGYTIYNWDREAWGLQTMTGCMQHSLNVCLSWIATQKLGAARFYEYLDRFDIGRRTNIDLAGELVYPLSVPGDSTWSEVNLATNSFGQGLAITPIQLLTAVGAVANDGKMMAPHVLKEVVSADQHIVIQPRVIGSPITAETAKTLTAMLTESLREESSDALVEGYEVAGKTGTAEIAVEGQGYVTNLTNASFIGWGPSDDPKFVVYIWLEKPTRSMWGSIVAAPVFSEVVQELVVLMDLPTDAVREQIAAE